MKKRVGCSPTKEGSRSRITVRPNRLRDGERERRECPRGGIVAEKGEKECQGTKRRRNVVRIILTITFNSLNTCLSLIHTYNMNSERKREMNKKD